MRINSVSLLAFSPPSRGSYALPPLGKISSLPPVGEVERAAEAFGREKEQEGVKGQEGEREEKGEFVPAIDPRRPEYLLDEEGKSEKETESIRGQIKKEAEEEIERLRGEMSAQERAGERRNLAETAGERSVISKLEARDQEVRAHEAAHVAAGGSYVRGAASFSFQRGPNGQNYAVGGEVQIDISPVPGDPEATLAKMEIVKAAALAPAEPSGADLSIASAASQEIAAANAEIADKHAQELAGKFSNPEGVGFSESDDLGSQIDIFA